MTIQIIAPTAPTPRICWPQALYLHIPFCPRRCHYCDFAVTLGTPDLIEHYVQYLIKEIALTPTQHQGLRTVYLGGGTPSILSLEQLARILNAVEDHFRIQSGAEITLECNPDTVDLAKFYGYRALGINRISLGAEAFQDRLLIACGRTHTTQKIYQAVEELSQAGFDNFSLDLMFGLPEQTIEDWQVSLESAKKLGPHHISGYDLIVEENSSFGRKFQLGKDPLPSEDTTILMYQVLIDQFKSWGYEHYEIASLALPGYQSCHNRIYWHNQAYYGLGLGATGYVHHQRITRPRRLAEYFTWVDQGQWLTSESVSLEDELSETLMLGLRLVEGVDLITLNKYFGIDLVDQKLASLRGCINRGLVQIKNDRLCLIYPEGFLLSNEVLTCLI